MRRVLIFFLPLFLFGCVEADNSEVMKDRAVEKPSTPLEVSFEKLEKQRVDLKELFSTTYITPKFSLERDPFSSVVDVYKKFQEGELATTNPLLVHKFDEFKLVGILTGDVGNIAVLAVENESFYLKTGEIFSSNRSTILFIGQDYIKVRDNKKDIFGNSITEVKEIKLDDLKDYKEKTS